MANVISQMLEHLGSVQVGKTSADLLKEASEVENQDERLTFIQTLFENFHLNQPMPLESKDSQLFIERGYFHQAKSAMEFGDLEYALKRLNEGLTLIPKAECQLLSTAYALRAEILLRGRHFEAAALDVANATFGAEKVAGWDARLNKMLALSNKFSKIPEDDSKRKQEIESGDFGKAPETFVTADQNLEETRSEKMPALQVEVPNPLVPCASEALTLSRMVNGMMHFVAARDIKPGEILMVEEPLVFKADHTQYDRCSHCFKTVIATLPCSGCCWVRLLIVVFNIFHN
jgi:hypothetical protein